MFSFSGKEKEVLKYFQIFGFDQNKRLQICESSCLIQEKEKANADFHAVQSQISSGNELQASNEVHRAYICPHMNTHPS